MENALSKPKLKQKFNISIKLSNLEILFLVAGWISNLKPSFKPVMGWTEKPFTLPLHPTFLKWKRNTANLLIEMDAFSLY